MINKPLNELWWHVCELYDYSREHIHNHPDLMVVIPKRVKLWFWKVKKEIEGLYDCMQPKKLTVEDRVRLLKSLNEEEDEYFP